MPIYEYKCSDCGEKFDVFVFSHAENTIECANCESENTERLLSSFASSLGTPGGGSSCGGSGRFT